MSEFRLLGSNLQPRFKNMPTKWTPLQWLEVAATVTICGAIGLVGYAAFIAFRPSSHNEVLPILSSSSSPITLSISSSSSSSSSLIPSSIIGISSSSSVFIPPSTQVNLYHFAPLVNNYVDIVNGNAPLVLTSFSAGCEGFYSVPGTSISAWRSTCDVQSSYMTVSTATPLGSNTQCVWFRPTQYSIQNTNIFGCDTSSSKGCLQLWYTGSQFAFRMDTQGAATPVVVVTPLPLFQWTHICVVTEMLASTMQLYLNATATGPTTTVSTIWATHVQSPSILGGHGNGGTDGTRGGAIGSFLYWRLYTTNLDASVVQTIFTLENGFANYLGAGSTGAYPGFSSSATYDALGSIHLVPLMQNFIDKATGTGMQMISGGAGCESFAAAPGTSIVSFRSTCTAGSSYLIADVPATPYSSQTQCIWFNPTSRPTGNTIIFGCDNESGNAACLQLWYSGTLFAYRMTPGPDAPLTTTALLPLNQWMHICVVLDAPNKTMRLFLNGTAPAAAGSITSSWASFDMSQPMVGGHTNTVFKINGGATGYFLYYRMTATRASSSTIQSIFDMEAPFTNFIP